MLSITNYQNADATLIKLLKYLHINIGPELIIAELERHPDYPSFMAVSDVLTAFKIEINAFREGKFLQLLYSLISMAEDWKSKYILADSQSGKFSFAGIEQENQVLAPNQKVFYINPGNEEFSGKWLLRKVIWAK